MSDFNYEGAMCAISGVFAIPFILIAPFVTLILNTKEDSKDTYGEFLSINFLSIFICLGIIIVIGLIVIMIQGCINYIISIAPALRGKIRNKIYKSNKLNKPQNANSPITASEFGMIVYPVILLFVCPLGSYLIYNNTDLSKFESVFAGNFAVIAGGLILSIIYIKIILPHSIRLCIYFGTHNASCRICLQQCSDPEYDAVELTEVVV